MSWKDVIADLVGNAEMSFGFINGQGLGAVLLALVIIVFLLRVRPDAKSLVELFKSVRPSRLSNDSKSKETSAISMSSETKCRTPAE